MTESTKIGARIEEIARNAKILALGLVVGLAGCTTVAIPLVPTTPTQTYKSLTGNWQIQLAATSGPLPFSTLSGFIDEGTTFAKTGYPTTASFQLSQPSSCYAGTVLIPAAGQYLNLDLGIYSFTVDGQYLDMTAVVNATGTQFTGTYGIQDGCAGSLNSQGTIQGTRYADLNGTYSGTTVGTSPALAISVKVAQAAAGNSDGTSSLTGTVAFSGSSCFAQAALPSQSGYVLGSTVHLVFSDPATSALVTMVGTFDPAATTITLQSIDVSGGACQGSLGTSTLTL